MSKYYGDDETINGVCASVYYYVCTCSSNDNEIFIFVYLVKDSKRTYASRLALLTVDRRCVFVSVVCVCCVCVLCLCVCVNFCTNTCSFLE